MFFMDWAFIAYSVYVPFLIFIYILENAAIFKHRKNVFSSSFYKIFTVLSIVNIIACLVGSFVSRLNLYPLVNRFYAGMMEFSSYYLNCLSEFLGLFMAFNRFTTMYFPLTHDKVQAWTIRISIIDEGLQNYAIKESVIYITETTTLQSSIWFNMVLVTVVCNALSSFLYGACFIRLCLFSTTRNSTLERNFLFVGFFTMVCSVPYMTAMVRENTIAANVNKFVLQLVFGLNLSVEEGQNADIPLLLFVAFQLPWLTDLKYLTPAPMLLITNISIRRAISKMML
ncbi:hypothetical protein PFISCL1PPCAC_14493, partial [Pristionchus fissidentatus]